MLDWREKYGDKLLTTAAAASTIESGDVIACSIGSGIPYAFLDALADRSDELSGVYAYMGMASKPVKIYLPKYNDAIAVKSLFFGPVERTFQKMGSKIIYQPIHLSDTSLDRGYYHRMSTIAVVGTPPDENGMISLGPCPFTSEFLGQGLKIIVQVNEKLPYVRGVDCMFPADQVTWLVDGTEEITAIDPQPYTEIESKIAGFIVERVRDGACIQLGIGGIGTAVGHFLRTKKDLGIHTEMFVESMVELMECGAVNNSRKNFCPGKSVFGFAMGSKHMYEFMDRNPDLEARPFSWVNDPRIISENDNMVSINSAMQVDLTGQVCSESIGQKEYSGTGGQVDYVRGGHWSRGGMSFITLPSTRTDSKGNRYSKITPTLPNGSAVTTLRSDVHFVVTEYGCAEIRNDPLDVRARKLIAIAHPDFRDQLTFEAGKAGLIL